MVSLRSKKVVLFPEIEKFFYRSPTRIVECASEYKWKILRRISPENLTGYNDIACIFALCTFNLFDRDVNFSWLLI